jgi:hypothetical protein
MRGTAFAPPLMPTSNGASRNCLLAASASAGCTGSGLGVLSAPQRRHDHNGMDHERFRKCGPFTALSLHRHQFEPRLELCASGRRCGTSPVEITHENQRRSSKSALHNAILAATITQSRTGLNVFSPSPRGKLSKSSTKGLGDHIQPEGQFDSSRTGLCARLHS